MRNQTAVTPAILGTPQVTPSTVNSARREASRVLRKAPLPANDKPLQLRLPRAEVKSIKLAAAEREQTISELMLACFHAYMKATKRA